MSSSIRTRMDVAAQDADIAVQHMDRTNLHPAQSATRSQADTPRRWAVEGTVNAGDTFEYTLTIDPERPVTQQPPVANGGPDLTVSAGDACNVSTQLDGSASADPGGEALTFLWGGPFGSATGVRPTGTLPVGTHEIRLVTLDARAPEVQIPRRLP